MNLDFRDLEEINVEDFVGIKKKIDSFLYKFIKRLSSIDDELKFFFLKRINVDVMYDKDFDEDK